MRTQAGELARQLRQLSDEELRDRLAAGTLQGVARTIALEELAARGIDFGEDRIVACPEYEGDYEVVGRFLNPTDAHIVCSCLEASGIPAVVADANLVQTNSLWAVAVGGARLLVPAVHVAEAKEIIAAFNRGDLELRDDDDIV